MNGHHCDPSFLFLTPPSYFPQHVEGTGITYDGKGNFSGTKAFNEWKDRFVWLKQKGVADLRYVAAGLSVDSEYDEADVENRLKVLMENNVDAIHIFADTVPTNWIKPLQLFLKNDFALHTV